LLNYGAVFLVAVAALTIVLYLFACKFSHVRWNKKGKTRVKHAAISVLCIPAGELGSPIQKAVAFGLFMLPSSSSPLCRTNVHNFS